MCDLCAEKDRTIAAQEQTITALTEMVNLQRALPTVATPGIQAPAVPLEGPGLQLVPDEQDLEEDARAQLNAGGVDTETAERLLAQLQVAARPAE